jgi:hypothetical protein
MFIRLKTITAHEQLHELPSILLLLTDAIGCLEPHQQCQYFLFLESHAHISIRLYPGLPTPSTGLATAAFAPHELHAEVR